MQGNYYYTILKKVLLLSVILLPFSAGAAFLHVGGEYFLKGSEELSDDTYVLAPKAAFSGTALGDAAVLAREIESHGEIGADALFLGEQITVGGSVGDDARVAGGVVAVSGDIAGDAVIFGSEITLTEGARIGGNLYLVGGRAELRGSVEGDVKALAGEIVFGGFVGGSAEAWGEVSATETARVAGDLIYHDSREIRVPDGVVSGEIIFDKRLEKGFLLPWSGRLPVVFGLMVLALGFVLLFFARARTEEVLLDAGANFWMQTLRGAIVFVLVPVVAVALVGTVVGFFIGVVLLSLFFAAVFLSLAGTGMLLGSAAERFLFRRSPFPLSYRPVLLGTVLFALLFVIPYIGFAINFVIFLSVLGALETAGYRYMTSLT